MFAGMFYCSVMFVHFMFICIRTTSSLAGGVLAEHVRPLTLKTLMVSLASD